MGGVISVFQTAIIPALFIILAALLMTHGMEPERVHRRYLLFFMIAGALILGFMASVDRLDPNLSNPSLFQVSGLLTPALIGVLAISLLHLRSIAEMQRTTQLWVVLLIVTQAVG